MIVCQKGGNISREYKLPPKKTIGVINNVGIIDICSKLELINPIKKPNNAKVKATKTNKNIINKGYSTCTSTKNKEVINITSPTGMRQIADHKSSYLGSLFYDQLLKT